MMWGAVQAMAFFCKAAERERAASAITMALSPASTRSMTTIASSAERNSMELKSIDFVHCPGDGKAKQEGRGEKKPLPAGQGVATSFAANGTGACCPS